MLKKLKSNRGSHTLEIVVVIVVLLTVALIFREQLLNIITNVFSHVNSSINGMF